MMRLPSSVQTAAVLLPLLLLGVTQSGCVYRMNIQQGNFLEQRALDQLKVGMTRSQVRYLLGTPMIPDAFDEDRWDYLYYLKKGRLQAPEQRHLVVYFEGDKVVRIEGDHLQRAAGPADGPQEPAQPPERQASAKPSPATTSTP